MARFDLTGKTVLITGATDGLGRALAREVLDAGATVIVHGRSADRIEATVDELDGGGGVRSYRADFASLAQVHGLADALIAADERIDVLVNNAGIGARTGRVEEREVSADGHELRFAVNYLAGFALTQRLLAEDRIAERIVNVSSLGQQAIDFDDVMLERGYSGVRAYCQSKLAQILSTEELAPQVAPALTVNALHPATYMPTKMVPSPISTLEEGVEATFRLVADPALDTVTGRFFDGLREAQPDAQAADAEARRRLWALSEDLTARR
ncbi:FabG-like 3-oxoacyl-(acyl-carrier-protein) reductase [Baekduia alba]|uniref:SDR family NAD(P)-dependent oxidoreductase n=1 Tax=Baekduia alba TaxID=2997333 RepID=UPI00233FC6BC|nr:SDR family NAD(P)-dependent oxidoreductase [Baekduia alba]WCB93036.1 FabG-like 3-oxoacyl-(acyl-carrier-protein) reductase [Baekduia alba]